MSKAFRFDSTAEIEVDSLLELDTHTNRVQSTTSDDEPLVSSEVELEKGTGGRGSAGAHGTRRGRQKISGLTM